MVHIHLGAFIKLNIFEHLFFQGETFRQKVFIINIAWKNFSEKTKLPNVAELIVDGHH